MKSKRAFSITSRHHSDAQGWKAIDLPTRFLVYELVRGGIEDAELLTRYAGRPIRKDIIEGIVESCDNLVYGPLHPVQPVRCGNCGRMLIDLPCRKCGRLKSHYKPVEGRTFEYAD